MMNLLAPLSALTLSLSPALGDAPYAEVFEPSDEIVGARGVYYIDPEFGPDNTLIFFNGVKELWLGWIDPATGDLVPEDGRGILLDEGIDIIPQRLFNGPEFALSQRGMEIVYPKYIEGEGRQLFRIQDALGTPTVTQMTHGPVEHWIPYPSQSWEDETSQTAYYARTGPIISMRWLEDDGAEIDEVVPDAGDIVFKGPRWIPGERSILVTLGEVGVDSQVYAFDVDRRAFTQLSSGDGWHHDGQVLSVPAFEDRRILVTNYEQRGLDVFLEGGGGWEPLHRVTFPSSMGWVGIWEPFLYEGRPYVASQVAVDDPSSPSEVWIASLDPAHPMTRRVDAGPASLIRFDPEAYVAESDVYIFYYEMPTFRLHRCATGLAQDPIHQDD